MEDLQNLPLSSLCATLLLGYNVSNIDLSFKYRHEVATRVWINCQITFHDSKSFDVSGSTNGIVKRKIIELMERLINK